MARAWWSMLFPWTKKSLAKHYFDCKPDELTHRQIVHIHFMEKKDD